MWRQRPKLGCNDGDCMQAAAIGGGNQSLSQAAATVSVLFVAAAWCVGSGSDSGVALLFSASCSCGLRPPLGSSRAARGLPPLCLVFLWPSITSSRLAASLRGRRRLVSSRPAPGGSHQLCSSRDLLSSCRSSLPSSTCLVSFGASHRLGSSRCRLCSLCALQPPVVG